MNILPNQTKRFMPLDKDCQVVCVNRNRARQRQPLIPITDLSPKSVNGIRRPFLSIELDLRVAFSPQLNTSLPIKDSQKECAIVRRYLNTKRWQALILLD